MLGWSEILYKLLRGVERNKTVKLKMKNLPSIGKTLRKSFWKISILSNGLNWPAVQHLIWKNRHLRMWSHWDIWDIGSVVLSLSKYPHRYKYSLTRLRSIFKFEAHQKFWRTLQFNFKLGICEWLHFNWH